MIELIAATQCYVCTVAHELSSNGSQLKVPTHATGENETIRFQMCRTDNYTHFSVVVGKGSGPVYIGNARVDYPVYKKKDLTVTYNQEWFPDKFCKRVSIYINGGVLENGTILQFGLYQQINQTNPDIVGNVTVLLTEGDNNSGAKGSLYRSILQH